MLRTDITVGTLVERDDRFLVIEERVSGSFVFTQPGGHIEPGESPEVAAERETLEESACRVTVTNPLGIYLWIHPQTKQQHLRLMFLAEYVDEEAGRGLDVGIRSVYWFNEGDLLRRREHWRTPIVMRCIEDFRAGRRQPVELDSLFTTAQADIPAMLASASVV